MPEPGPLHGRREIPAARFKPDVDALVVPARTDLRRQRHTPAQVTRDGSRLQTAFQKVDREAVHVGAPVGHRPRPVEQRLLEFGQVEVEVLGLAPLERRVRVQPRARVDQVLGLEQTPAVFALVAARPRVVAVRTFTFDVGVREKPPGDRVIEPDRFVPVQQALVQQHHELVLHNFAVVVRRGRRVQVVAHAQVAPVGQELGVVARRDVGRAGAFLVGAHRDRRAVGVGA